MKNRFPYAMAALVWGITLIANAQVYRCKTATGGTEYSQVPCGKDAQLLQSRENSIDTKPSRSPLDALRQRETANQAREDAFRKPQTSRTNTESQGVATRRAIDPTACQNAEREAQIEARHARKDVVAIKRAYKTADWECGRDIQDDPVSANTPPVPMKVVPPPPIITSCDQSGCWDSNGGRYNRAGNSDTYFTSSGACTRVGMSMICP